MSEREDRPEGGTTREPRARVERVNAAIREPGGLCPRTPERSGRTGPVRASLPPAMDCGLGRPPGDAAGNDLAAAFYGLAGSSGPETTPWTSVGLDG